MIPLSGGFPNPQMFPFKQLTLEVSGGDPIVLQGKGLQVIYISHALPKLILAMLPCSHCQNSFWPLPNPQAALQYLPTPGHPRLLQQLRQLQEEAHTPDKVTGDASDVSTGLFYLASLYYGSVGCVLFLPL